MKPVSVDQKGQSTSVWFARFDEVYNLMQIVEQKGIQDTVTSSKKYNIEGYESIAIQLTYSDGKSAAPFERCLLFQVLDT
jgi:hypothetical protein